MIELSGVSVKFPRSPVILDQVDWMLGAGDFACVSGASGSGKTTLLKLLSAQLEANEGAVKVFNRNLAKLRASSIVSLRRLLGVVPQEIELFDEQTVYDNVAVTMEICAMARGEIRARVHSSLARLGLEDMAHVAAGRLSTGQRRRVAIARALAKGPRVLLADEPTGDLDDRWTEVLLEYLAVLRNQGLTAVVTTHDDRVLSTLSSYRWWHYQLREGNLCHLAAMVSGEIVDTNASENIVQFPFAARAAGAFE